MKAWLGSILHPEQLIPCWVRVPQYSYSRKKSLIQTPSPLLWNFPLASEAHVLVNIPTQDGSGLGSPFCSAMDQHHHTQRRWTLCLSPSIQSKFRPQDSLVSFVHTDHMGTRWWPRDCIDRRTEMEARCKFTKKLNSTTALNTGMKHYSTLTIQAKALSQLSRNSGF